MLENQMARTKISLAVLGAGKIGGILLTGMIQQGLFSRQQITATVRHAERARELSKRWKVQVGTDNAKAAHEADVILLCVKPQVLPEVLREIGASITERQLL